jgi:2,4-dienoyl-CoA reductase-like NADH-dependent reductase (Old Yellow Enzyme family)
MDLNSLINQLSDTNEQLQKLFDEFIVYMPDFTAGGIGWLGEEHKQEFYKAFEEYLSELEKFYRLNSRLNRELERLESVDVKKTGLLKPISEDVLVWAEFKKRLPRELRAMGYKDVKTFSDAVEVIRREGADLVDVAQRLLRNIKMEEKEKSEKALGLGSEPSKETKFEEIERQLFL